MENVTVIDNTNTIEETAAFWSSPKANVRNKKRILLENLIGHVI